MGVAYAKEESEDYDFRLWCDQQTYELVGPSHNWMMIWIRREYCRLHGYQPRISEGKVKAKTSDWEWPFQWRVKWVFEFHWASHLTASAIKMLWWLVDQLGITLFGGDTWGNAKSITYFCMLSVTLTFVMYGLDWLFRPIAYMIYRAVDVYRWMGTCKEGRTIWRCPT